MKDDEAKKKMKYQQLRRLQKCFFSPARVSFTTRILAAATTLCSSVAATTTPTLTTTTTTSTRSTTPTTATTTVGRSSTAWGSRKRSSGPWSAPPSGWWGWFCQPEKLPQFSQKTYFWLIRPLYSGDCKVKVDEWTPYFNSWELKSKLAKL